MMIMQKQASTIAAKRAITPDEIHRLISYGNPKGLKQIRMNLVIPLVGCSEISLKVSDGIRDYASSIGLNLKIDISRRNFNSCSLILEAPMENKHYDEKMADLGAKAAELVEDNLDVEEILRRIESKRK